MATMNENNIQDDTSSDVNETNESINNPAPVNESSQAKHGRSGTISAMAGVAGVAAGVGGAILISGFKEPEEEIMNPDPGTQPMHEPVDFNGEEVPEAHNVNNDMSFSEAFTTARQEVGPGGVFSWHGGTYGTYYTDEWNELPDEYRQHFSNYPFNLEHEPYVADGGQTEESDTTNGFEGDNEPLPAEPEETEFTSSATVEQQPAGPEMGGELIPEDLIGMPDDDNKVSILNAESSDVEGQEVTVISTGVDGQDTVLVGGNLDDAFHVTVVDETVETENISVYELDDQGLPIESLEVLPDTLVDDNSVYDYQDPASSAPDFMNNADIDDFA